MIIANPIYDSVFKFLMDDLEAAKILISNIIGQKVLALDPKPTETVSTTPKYFLSILRFDYKAVVETEGGEHKVVLIELQKAAELFDIQRFRRYLGENYAKKETVNGDEISLPIICIYFLGFNIGLEYPVLESEGQIIDVSTRLPIQDQDEAKKIEFIKLLTHTSFFIQILKLPGDSQVKLLRLLTVFNQKFVVSKDEKWKLKFIEMDQISDPELKLMAKRLLLAASDQKVQEEISAENEVGKMIENFERKQEKELEEKDKIIESKEQQVEAERQKAEAERQKAEAQIRQSVINIKKRGFDNETIAEMLNLPADAVLQIVKEEGL